MLYLGLLGSTIPVLADLAVYRMGTDPYIVRLYYGDQDQGHSIPRLAAAQDMCHNTTHEETRKGKKIVVNAVE